MQITVCFIGRKKEIDNAFSPGANYSLHESGLQITLRLLSSSLGNTVLLHTLFLKYETQIGKKNKKILDNVFQSNCSSHAKLLTNLRKIEKRPKIRHRLFMHSALQLYNPLSPIWGVTIHGVCTFIECVPKACIPHMGCILS